MLKPHKVNTSLYQPFEKQLTNMLKKNGDYDHIRSANHLCPSQMARYSYKIENNKVREIVLRCLCTFTTSLLLICSRGYS